MPDAAVTVVYQPAGIAPCGLWTVDETGLEAWTQATADSGCSPTGSSASAGLAFFTHAEGWTGSAANASMGL